MAKKIFDDLLDMPKPNLTPIEIGTPVMIFWRGDGVTTRFRFPKYKMPSEEIISVFHHRGGKERAKPKNITGKAVIFLRPPQKGDKIIAIYKYNNGDHEANIRP